MTSPLYFVVDDRVMKHSPENLSGIPVCVASPGIKSDDLAAALNDRQFLLSIMDGWLSKMKERTELGK